MNATSPAPGTRRIIPVLALVGLLALAYLVLRPFLVPVTWACILVYITWPLYRWLREMLGGRATLASLLATLLLAAVLALPAFGLVFRLQDEVVTAYQTVSTQVTQGQVTLPDFVLKIPGLGHWLQDNLARISADPTAIWAGIEQWLDRFGNELLQLVGNVGRNALKFGFALLTLFFLYRDGETLVVQTSATMERMLGERTQAYLDTIVKTTKAVIYGLLLTALGQGALAGIGYWAAGVPGPVLLGTLTAVFALIPFGSPLVWGSAGLWLLFEGHLWAGVGLLIWGAVIVSSVDNFIRPLVISSATRIPFLIVLFGSLGGIAAFGLIGLFVGPVILAVLMGVWREWLEEQKETAKGSAI